MLWMIDNQLGKRNVSIMSRVMLAESFRNLIASRQGANQYTERASAQNCTEAPTHPRDQLADKAGVSANTYRAAKLILEAEQKGEITPEVAQAVRTNKIAVHRVAKDIKETRQKAAREEKRLDSAKDIEIPDNLIIGDFRSQVATDDLGDAGPRRGLRSRRRAAATRHHRSPGTVGLNP